MNELLQEEEARDPINICDDLLMSNYFLKGEKEAFEIKKFEEIQECKQIKNSCCEEDELQKQFKNFQSNQMPTLIKKYKMLNQVVSFFVTNYSSFIKYAYKIMNLKFK